MELDYEKTQTIKQEPRIREKNDAETGESLHLAKSKSNWILLPTGNEKLR